MWVKLDDGFAEHPAIATLTAEAFRLLVASFCYCGRNLTDGRIPLQNAHRLSPSARPKHVAELLDSGRWIEHLDHYEVRSFLEFNPSAEQVKRDREAAAARQRRRRGHDVSHAVTDPVTSGVSHTTPTRPDPSTARYTDTSSLQSGDAGDGDDIAQAQTIVDRMTEAATALAQREAERRGAEIGNVKGYVRSRIPALRREHADAWERILEAEPATTAAQLAETVLGTTTAARPSPQDGTAAAERARMALNAARVAGTVCAVCHGTGWRETDEGAVRCLHLAAVADA